MKIDIHETEAVAERSRSAAGMRAADETLAPTGARPTAADRVRTALLEQFMPSLGVVRRALHLGCAETALLLAIGECSASVRAVDADDSHIARAREDAAAAGLNRVQFVCGAMGGDLPEGEFDLISLSHVLSGSADEQELARHLAMLVARLVPHGHLVTQDWIGGQAAAESLRSQEAWRHALSDAGLRCVCAQQIESDAEGAVHWLMLWRRPAAPTDTVSAEVPVAEAAGQGAVRAQRTGDEPSELAALMAQQERQSEVLLQIGQMVLALGQQMQAIESRLTSAAGMQPVIERIDRIESTLHWLARQPRAAVHGPVRVAFLIHHAAAWPALRGIVDAMRGAADFEPVVVSLPHCFPMLGKLGGEDDVHAMLTAQGYAHVRVPDAKADQALERVKMLNPQVIFRQAPWDADVPPGLQAQHLAFAKLCYVPYGYLTARIEQQQFDQLYHRLCWRIFCPDEAHRALFATHNLQAGSNCRVTGYPKFDHLLQGAGAAGAGADWPVSSPDPLAYRLIWAPHFSYEGSWLRFGVFDRMAEAMLRFVAGHRDVEVVLRPHPAMREAMDKAAADTLLGRVRERWNELPNTGWSTEQDYAGLFAASHALLTDGLSFFSEYQLFDKPLVFIERGDHSGFNAAGEQLLEGMYRVNSFEAFVSLFQRLRKGREEPVVVEARRRIARSLQPFPGEAARRIVDVIRNEFQEI